MRAMVWRRGVWAALLVMLVAGSAWAQQPAGGAAGDRSMAFQPGLGEAAQERVPGGRLVLLAYGFAVLAIGGYVAFVARSAAKLEEDVRSLEDALAKRGDGDEAR